MSIIVVYLLLVTAAALVLASAAVEQGRRIRQLRRVLDGTRRDLIGQLRAAENFRMAAEHASDGIVIQTMEGTILWANPAYCRMVRLPAAQILGRSPLEFVIPEAERPGAEEIAAFRYDRSDPHYHGLVLRLNQRGDGTLFWNQHSVSYLQSSSGEERVILVCRDVSAQIEDQERLREIRTRLEYAASHDILTGLANRSELLRFTSRALEQGGRVGMLHLDVDTFKDINDTHGHSAGDRTLQHVAERLRAGLRAGDLAARLGGDEFVVVCPEVAGLSALAGIGADLRRAIAAPFDWQGLRLSCDISVGAALSEAAGDRPEDLMLRSDFALYEAKRQGRARVEVYDEGLHQRHSAQVRLSHRLREAVEAGELIHHFQPVFDMRRGAVTGFEALLRWPQADGSMMPPDRFLPLAAQLGLMGRIDLGSMEAALQMQRRLNWAGLGDLTVGFNASDDLLTHPEFIPRLVHGVESRRIDRGRIAIEILETTMFGSNVSGSSEAAVIADLKAAGFQVYLDDFGIGYAGLSHLAGLEVTGVKIDRSLVRNVLPDGASGRVVQAIVGLCEDLGLKVLAEGVEDRATAERLGAFGCTQIQGYWIGRPMPADAAVDWLRETAGAIEPLRAAL